MWYCPILAEKYGILVAIGSGVVLNMFSLFCGSIAGSFDVHAEKEMLA
jgi:hypothetical protein